MKLRESDPDLAWYQDKELDRNRCQTGTEMHRVSGRIWEQGPDSLSNRNWNAPDVWLEMGTRIGFVVKQELKCAGCLAGNGNKDRIHCQTGTEMCRVSGWKWEQDRER